MLAKSEAKLILRINCIKDTKKGVNCSLGVCVCLCVCVITLTLHKLTFPNSQVKFLCSLLVNFSACSRISVLLFT